MSVLHNQCPSKNEWSGVLVYEITEGSPEKLDEPLTMRAHAVFPMDFGNGAYTEYESDTTIFELFKQFPEVDPVSKDPNWFIGHIHSHHDMSAFFSGTDTDELLTNVKNLPMYLSLIVNYACNPVAKLAVVADVTEEEHTITTWNLRGSKKSNKEEKKASKTHTPAYVIECDVLYEATQWFIDQIAKVEEKKKAKYTTPQIPKYPGKSWGRYYDPYDNDYDIYGNKLPSQKPKNAAPKQIGFKVGSDKETKTISRTQNRTVERISELLSLGQNEWMGAYQCLAKVNETLDDDDVQDYVHAMTWYFLQTWFPQNFYDITQCSEQDVIKCVTGFLEHHKNLKIVDQLIKWTNEFGDNIDTLREIQRSAVV